MTTSSRRATLFAFCLLTGCAASPRPVSLIDDAVTLQTERGVARQFGILRESCRWDGPNPVIAGPRTEPRVGTRVQVDWHLNAFVAPHYVEGDERPPAPAIALLASNRPLLSPVLVGPMAPGCALLVNPDYVFVPAPNTWFSYDTDRLIATVQWTPVDGTHGLDLFLQLLVFRPEANALGVISSQGLQLHIGEAHP